MSGQFACEWTREFCRSNARSVAVRFVYRGYRSAIWLPLRERFDSVPTCVSALSLPEHLTAVLSSTGPLYLIQNSFARLSKSNTSAGNVSTLATAERTALGNTTCDAPARHDLRHLGLAVPAASLGHTLPSRLSAMSKAHTSAGNVSTLTTADRTTLGKLMLHAMYLLVMTCTTVASPFRPPRSSTHRLHRLATVFLLGLSTSWVRLARY